jgi:iron complex transport system substrate-binding protein
VTRALTRRRFLGAAVAATVAPRSAWAQRRVVVDGAGRRVEIPARVRRVFPAGGPAGIFLYTLAPDAMLGWTRAVSAEERPWLPAKYADLPALGRLTGRGNTANVEVVLSTQPDIVLDFGSVGPTYVSLADRVQDQSKVPYVLLDGSLSATSRAYALAGDILGVADRAGELARYVERTLGDVDRRVASVPRERRPSVYYARGPRGLETATPGSINAESLDRLGARNVAAGGGGNLTTVSLEQVLAWSPDVILTIDPAFHAAVGQDPSWRGVRAVREGRVYQVPLLPFPWIDFPPSVNRVIGLRWLGHVLYPGAFPGSARDEVRAFYGLFYHRAPDDRQLDALLGVKP